MSRLTREDEHRLNDYNRRVKQSGLDSLSEDEQLWYSLLNDRYEKFLEVGIRIMSGAAAQKEKKPEASTSAGPGSSGGSAGGAGNTTGTTSSSSGGGIFSFLANVGASSYNANRKGPSSIFSSSNNNSAVVAATTNTRSNTETSMSTHGGSSNSPTCPTPTRNQSSSDGVDADEGSDLTHSPRSPITASKESLEGQNKRFAATFGHPPPSAPSSEFPSSHWTWLQENLVVGAIPYIGSAVGSGSTSGGRKEEASPGHIFELQEQCLRRLSKISLVVSCLELDEEPPEGFCSLKDWDTVVGGGTTSFISVPLPKDPNQPIPKSVIHEVISACAQISAISQANMRTSGGGDHHMYGGSLSDLSGLNNTSSTGADDISCGGGGSFGNRETVMMSSSNAMGDSSPTPNAAIAGGASPSPLQSSTSVSVNNSPSPSRVSIVGGALRRLTQAHPKQPSRKRVAYVHCKAGTQRCFVVAACYLMSQHGKTYDEVERFMRFVRPSFRPSRHQMDFVRSFGEYIAKPIVLQPRSDDEERYQKVLAEVLSLSAKGRERLLRDLEKLT